MPTFTGRKFKLPGSGSAGTMTMFNKTLEMQEDNMRNNGGISSGEYQKLIDLGIGMMSPGDTASQRISKEATINRYKNAMDRIDNRFVETPENISSTMRNDNISNNYINGDSPLVALEQKVRILDEAVFRYDNAILARRRDNLPIGDLMSERRNTISEFKEFNSILKSVQDNVASGGKNKLDGMAYVVTPGANGEAMNTEIVPSRMVGEAIRTNSYTAEGLPLYVIPNRRLPGRDQAVIGPYVFEENTGKMNNTELRALRNQLIGEGFKGAELNNQIRLAIDQAEPSFQVKSFDGSPASSDDRLDLSSFGMSPTLNEGEYGVGGSGIYNRKDGKLRLINATPGQFALRPGEMKQLDTSLEAMMKPEIQQVIDPTELDPASGDNFWNFMPEGSGFGPGIPPQQEASAEQEGAPDVADATVNKPPTVKEQTGLGGFMNTAKSIFSSVFGK